MDPTEPSPYRQAAESQDPAIFGHLMLAALIVFIGVLLYNFGLYGLLAVLFAPALWPLNSTRHRT